MSARCNSTIAVGVMALSIAGCATTEGPRDPRMDANNIYAAASGSKAYQQFLEGMRLRSEAAVRRERSARERNLMLSSDLSELDARKQALSEELTGLQGEVAELNAASTQVKTTTETERQKLADLNARKANLEARANALKAAPPADTSKLEEELTALQAEQRVLLQEYESLL